MKVLLIKEYKIQLVYQFLYFLLFYIASEFTSADIIFNIHWKKIFATNFHFLTDSPKPTTLLLSVTKVFCWCSLNLENFWFYIWVVVLWLNLTRQMTLPLTHMPINKIIDCKDHQMYSKMLSKICIYVKRKANISFRVIKNSSLDRRFLMVKTFLEIIWWRFLVPHSEHLLASNATLSCMTQNVLALPMLVYYDTNSFILRRFSHIHSLLVCSSSLIIKVFRSFAWLKQIVFYGLILL